LIFFLSFFLLAEHLNAHRLFCLRWNPIHATINRTCHHPDVVYWNITGKGKETEKNFVSGKEAAEEERRRKI